MELYVADTTRLPRLGVRPIEYEGGTCRLGMYDTPAEAWAEGIANLEAHRDRIRDAVWLLESQLRDAEMWLAEYRRNLAADGEGT